MTDLTNEQISALVCLYDRQWYCGGAKRTYLDPCDYPEENLHIPKLVKAGCMKNNDGGYIVTRKGIYHAREYEKKQGINMLEYDILSYVARNFLNNRHLLDSYIINTANIEPNFPELTKMAVNKLVRLGYLRFSITETPLPVLIDNRKNDYDMPELVCITKCGLRKVLH